MEAKKKKRVKAQVRERPRWDVYKFAFWFFESQLFVMFWQIWIKEIRFKMHHTNTPPTT